MNIADLYDLVAKLVLFGEIQARRAWKSYKFIIFSYKLRTEI